MSKGTFATAINCMDGRVQDPVTRWMRQELGVDYVDMITEPGADRAVALGTPSQVDSIRRRVGISVEKHHSTAVAVVGHHDCAGNPVSNEAHRDQIRHAVRIIESWRFPVRVLGLWVNQLWVVEAICDSPPPGR